MGCSGPAGKSGNQIVMWGVCVCVCPRVSLCVRGFSPCLWEKQCVEVKLAENQSIKTAMTNCGETKAREEEKEEQRERARGGVRCWITICILSLATVNDGWLESLSDVFMP